MTRYSIRVSPAAADRVADYAEFIAERSGSVDIARRWVDRVYSAIDSLAYWPRRFAFAEENDHLDYEIRRLIVGRHLVLYTVDDEDLLVKVIGFRHGSRLPRPEELPEKP